MNTRSFSSATSRKTGALCRDSDPGPAQNSRILAQRAGRSILPMRLPTGLKIITPSSGSPRPQPHHRLPPLDAKAVGDHASDRFNSFLKDRP